MCTLLFSIVQYRVRKCDIPFNYQSFEFLSLFISISQSHTKILVMPREVIDLTVPTTFTEVEDTPVWPALQVAIDEAQPHRLRETLRRLCMDSRDTARAAQAILVVPVQRSRSKTNMAEEEEDEDQDEDKDDEPDESESDSSSKNEAAEAEAISNTLQGLKRMRPRYVRCRNCKEEFDITQNESGDCSYHPGESS